MGEDRADHEGAALRFACLPPRALHEAAAQGISHDDKSLYDTLDEAEAACRDGERVVAVAGDGSVPNAHPYLPPAPVVAAGGLVVRRDDTEPGGEPLLLLIYRRGAWDLPKGKLDPGETVEACALREVREEVGIETLATTGEAGTTVHGYPEDGRYLVKTTYWYFMRTPERSFTPEANEGIEAVEWVPWGEARGRLGYATLRHLLGRLDVPEAAE